MAVGPNIIRSERERVSRELAAAKERVMRLEVELDVLTRLQERSNDSGPKLGPTEAVMHVLGKQPGIARGDLIAEAVEITKTNPKRARDVVAQTIRNLTDKRIRVVGEHVYVLESKNGHGTP